MTTAGSQPAGLGAQILKTFKPTISDQTRFGAGCRDNATQTERSDIVQLEETFATLENILRMASALKKELTMATYSLRMESKTLISDHATELYHHANNRLMEMEKRHREQTDMLRRSFRTQLSDAVARISAEYKNYYDEILSGKTGRHDRKIRELTLTCNEQHATIKQNETVIQMLQSQIQKLAADARTEPAEPESVIVEAEPQGVLSQEEADELHATIENLQLRVRELQMEASDRDSGHKNLQRSLSDAKEQLELERAKVSRLTSELDGERRNAAAEGARSAADAHAQIAALKEQLREQKERLEQEADERLQSMLANAQSTAAAKLQAELAKQREIEEKLRRERDALAGQDSSKIVKQLQDQALHLQQTIVKLQREIKAINERWQLRMDIMERRLTGVREESLLRANLQKHAATLHRAAITYAPDGPVLMSSGDAAAAGFPPSVTAGNFPQPHQAAAAMAVDMSAAASRHPAAVYSHQREPSAPATWRPPASASVNIPP
ncbi:uncharacterized protein C10orf67, mitochondrial-like [Sycon ciliatum]|uniref:uncharacterized protein C10orf67, mitochondrial-like n=1 Tax=Sycon ciliatum TaxID=27933 RepID=UPI0031F6790C